MPFFGREEPYVRRVEVKLCCLMRSPSRVGVRRLGCSVGRKGDKGKRQDCGSSRPRSQGMWLSRQHWPLRVALLWFHVGFPNVWRPLLLYCPLPFMRGVGHLHPRASVAIHIDDLQESFSPRQINSDPACSVSTFICFLYKWNYYFLMFLMREQWASHSDNQAWRLAVSLDAHHLLLLLLQEKLYLWFQGSAPDSIFFAEVTSSVPKALGFGVCGS